MTAADHDPLAGADIADALADANIPTLLMVLAHLTGETAWLGEEFRPGRLKGLGDDDTGGLSSDVQDHIRKAAAVELAAHLESGADVRIPDADSLVDMMSFSVGEQVPREYGPMMAMDLRDQLAPRDSGTEADFPTVPEGFSVLVIGGGPSGLAAGVALKRVGIPFAIIDMNDDVAGTWQDNGYPGAAVDTPNHLYSFTFAPFDWSRFFASRDELRDYLVHLADRFELRPHLRMRTEALSARYDAGNQGWEVQVRNRDGDLETLTSTIVISAVGALNRPQIPPIPGLATFVGPSFHTARWPEGLDVTGKRVAVIGTGASAMQLVPAIVDAAESVTVFQRSPQWAAPFEKFQVEVSPPLRRVLVEVPLYRAWYRLRQGWIFNDKVFDSLQKDPSWPDKDRSINSVNDAHRQYFTRYIHHEIEGRPDLLEKVLPTYPPFGKRMLLDNGWYRAMTRDDVVLETGAIAEVQRDRVLMQSGEEHVVDILVLATGFDAVHFLASVDVRGRSGATLGETWQGDDAKSYLGVTVPDYPNFFTLNGPNTMTGHGGSLLYLVECQLRYVVSLVRQMLEQDIGAVECRRDVYDVYNESVDEAHSRMIWTHQGMSTYYRNSRGRVVVNSPWRVVDFWGMTLEADLHDFVTEPRLAGPG
jgi:4-hydroxyacetophenone monooxygenase